MIDKQTVDRIYSAANIVEVVGDFITLKKKGINYQACCPFHSEKTPSFVVSPAKGLYKCFGCGKGGNAISFVMEHESMEYADALRYLARRYNVEIVEKERTPEDMKKNDDRESMLVLTSFASDYFKEILHNNDEGKNIGLSYFRERGFTDITIDKFGLGYCPTSGDALSHAALKSGYKEDFLVSTGLSIKREDGRIFDRFYGRVMFPIHSIAGRVTAFGGRTMRTDKKVAKYQNSPESEIYHKSNVLYGLFFAKKAITQSDCAILVEGYTDVISMHQSGVENVVASSGTSLTTEQIKLIARFTKNVTVIYDGDSAGIKASIRGIDMILKEGLNVRIVLLPENEDPDSFARSHSASELREYISENEQDFISFKAKLLMSEAKNDPIKRAELISDIIQSISVIPNAVSRNVYIKECSELMRIDEGVLLDEIRKKHRDLVLPEEGREFMRNRERFDKSFTQPKPTLKGVAGSSIDKLEKELITYLLKYATNNIEFEDHTAQVGQTIIDELSADSIEFANPTYNTIYKEFCKIYPSEGDLSLGHLTSYPDIEVCNAVVDIVMREEVKPSKLWERNEIFVLTEEQMLHEAIPRAITLYKSKIIERMVDDLKLKLMEGGEGIFEIMRQIDLLNNARKAVSAKYQRIIL